MDFDDIKDFVKKPLVLLPIVAISGNLVPKIFTWGNDAYRANIEADLKAEYTKKIEDTQAAKEVHKQKAEDLVKAKGEALVERRQLRNEFQTKLQQAVEKVRQSAPSSFDPRKNVIYTDGKKLTFPAKQISTEFKTTADSVEFLTQAGLVLKADVARLAEPTNATNDGRIIHFSDERLIQRNDRIETIVNQARPLIFSHDDYVDSDTQNLHYVFTSATNSNGTITGCNITVHNGRTTKPINDDTPTISFN